MLDLLLRNMSYVLQFILQRKKIMYFDCQIFIPNGLDYKTKLQLYFRRYERPEIAAILRYGRSGVSVLEIGGGCGVLSKIIDDKLLPTTHVIYEPLPLNVSRIESQELGLNTKVVGKAIASRDQLSQGAGQLEFRQRARVFGSGFSQKNRPDTLDDDVFIEVESISVDELESEQFDLIVMDVEGHEDILLPEICSSFINSTVIFEFHSVKSRRSLSAVIRECSHHDIDHFGDSTFVATPSVGV